MGRELNNIYISQKIENFNKKNILNKLLQWHLL